MEEFGDVDPSVAAALKDIISEKGLREGITKKESLISSIIITSNKDPETLATSNTIAALYKERFPIRHEVIWKNFNSKSYGDYLKMFYGKRYAENLNDFIILSEICSKTSKENLISPRIAVQAANIMLNNGLEYINCVSDLNTADLDHVIRELKANEHLLLDNKVINNVKDYLEQYDEKDELKKLRVLNYLKEKLSNHKFSNFDNIFHKLRELQSNIDKVMKEILFIDDKKLNELFY